MATQVTTRDAARALGTTPDALRKALQRDPDAPRARIVGGTSLWDLDRLLAWDQQRTRRTGRTTADKGRPVGSFALTPAPGNPDDMFATGVVTAWWTGDAIRFDLTTLPRHHEVEGAANLGGIESFDDARILVTAMSRHLTGVSEIGGEPAPVNLPAGPALDVIEGIGAVLAERIRGLAIADGAANRGMPDPRIDREVEALAGMSERLGGSFGPWERVTIMGVTRMADWALGDVQRALENALPGDERLQRAEFVRVVWIHQTHPATGWRGAQEVEDTLR